MLRGDMRRRRYPRQGLVGTGAVGRMHGRGGRVSHGQDQRLLPVPAPQHRATSAGAAGDVTHLDLSYAAFDQIAIRHRGVVEPQGQARGLRQAGRRRVLPVSRLEKRYTRASDDEERIGGDDYRSNNGMTNARGVLERYGPGRRTGSEGTRASATAGRTIVPIEFAFSPLFERS